MCVCVCVCVQSEFNKVETKYTSKNTILLI